jgi:hypothetical protein
MLIKELHSINATDPILEIPEGKVIFVRAEHPLNAQAPIDTVFGESNMVCSVVQSVKVKSLIAVTPDGIDMLERLAHDLNALEPISFNVAGKVIDDIPEQ